MSLPRISIFTILITYELIIGLEIIFDRKWGKHHGDKINANAINVENNA